MEPLLSGRARRLRLEMVASLAHGDVLDIGCGHTQLPDKLSGVTSYTGIDISEKAVAYGRRTYPHYTFRRLNLDSDPMPSFESQFDTVVMTAVLEHLHQPSQVIRAIRPLLKDDGLLLVTTPTPLGDFAHQIGSRIRLFYTEAIVGHVKIFSQNELRQLLSDAGYEIERYQRFVFGLNHFVVCRPMA